MQTRVVCVQLEGLVEEVGLQRLDSVHYGQKAGRSSCWWGW
jgi:hypothetical protein